MTIKYLVKSENCSKMPDCFCQSCVSDLWSVPNPLLLKCLSARCLVTFLIQETVRSLGSFQNSGSCVRGLTCSRSSDQSCHCKMTNRMMEMTQVISKYLTSFLPGGNLSRDTRELLLDTLTTCPVDPRVVRAREVVWCSLIDHSVENLKMEAGGFSSYHSGTSRNISFILSLLILNELFWSC